MEATHVDWQMVLEYVRVLAWPIAAVAMAIGLRATLRQFVSSRGVTISISGVEIEISAPEFEHLVAAEPPVCPYGMPVVKKNLL